MKHFIFLFFILFLNPFFIKGQDEMDSVTILKNALYLELLGTSTTIFSIHYDRVVKKMNNSYINLDVGFGYFPKFNGLHQNIGIPISINYTNRLYKRNHFEMGVGLTYSNGTFQQTNKLNEIEPFEALFGNVRLGYKYQNPENDIFFKAGFTPIIEICRLSEQKNRLGLFFPFIGLALGYSF